MRDSLRFRASTEVLVEDLEDWKLVASVPFNVCLRGPQHTIHAALATIAASFVEPVVTVRGGAPLTVLPRSEAVGTLILHDLGVLSRDEQRRLMAWREERAVGVRVVSTTSAPVLPLIETGEFLESLYYRLNTVYIDLTDEPQTLALITAVSSRTRRSRLIVTG